MSGPEPPSSEWRADFHIHTQYSGSVATSPGEAVQHARQQNLDRIAITDHGTIEGARQAQEIDSERVIIGQEITSQQGTQLIGLFLSRAIPDNQPLAQIARAIHKQGGLIYGPHPLGYLDRPDWHARRVLQVSDVIEGWSGRIFFGGLDWWVRKQARHRELPLLGGSDAHHEADIGRIYTRLPPFRDASSLLSASQHAHGAVQDRAGWRETTQALKPRLKNFFFGKGSS